MAAGGSCGDGGGCGCGSGTTPGVTAAAAAVLKQKITRWVESKSGNTSNARRQYSTVVYRCIIYSIYRHSYRSRITPTRSGSAHAHGRTPCRSRTKRLSSNGERVVLRRVVEKRR